MNAAVQTSGEGFILAALGELRRAIEPAGMIRVKFSRMKRQAPELQCRNLPNYSVVTRPPCTGRPTVLPSVARGANPNPFSRL